MILLVPEAVFPDNLLQSVLFPEKDEVHPILDPKTLNYFVWLQKFKMPFTCSVVAYLHQGDFLASIDIKDAY